MSLRLLFRTMGPLFAISVIALLAGMFAASQIQSIRQRGSRIVSENIASIRAAESMEATVMEVRYRLKRYLSNENERHLDEIQTLLPDLNRSLLEVRRSAATKTEQASYRMIAEGIDRLKAELLNLDRGNAATVGLASREIAEGISEDVIPSQIIEPLQRYIRENEQQVTEKNTRNHATADQLTVGFLILGILGGLAGLISGYLIARRVNNTLLQLSIPVHGAAGALHQVTQPIHVSQRGDFQSLETTMQEVETHVRAVVTRLQQSEREVLRTEQLAAMGQMAAGLGHELRNPLTSIKAILQLADEPSQLTCRDLSILKQEMGRLEHGLQSFLDFAKPAHPVKRQADIRPAVLQTLSLVARRAENKGVSLDSDIQDERLWGLADVAQIRQVVLNLLLNAIDAVAVGGRVHVDCRQVIHSDDERDGPENMKASERWFELRIRDDGPGLPAELGATIFEPFVSTKDAGLGLGLSICKRIIESHGGTLLGRDIKRELLSSLAEDHPDAEHRSPFDGAKFLDGAEFIVRLPLMPLHAHLGHKISCAN